MASLTCGNKGCNKKYVEDDNGETSCEHHSGAPVFHDALKGWSCCPKRVTDFNDFMNIPGCTVGRHVPVSATTTPVPTTPAAVTAKPTTIIDGKEVYGAAAPAATKATPPASKPSTPAVTPAIKEEDLNDAPNAVIPIGTSCKRKTCTHTFTGDESRTAECVFHSGSPIFHEGSKGWSCCSRKVLEFDEFLKIGGCKVGKHRFLDQETAESQSIECRRDWYQTPTTVIVSIFAKKADKARTTVTFTPTTLSISAAFLDSAKTYVEEIPLALEIAPDACKYMVLGTKIEVTLKKANGLSWPTLEMPKDGVLVKSFTTFGVRDGNGQDAPMNLIQK
ncbi:chord-domain-containing protein [Rhizoclosmatium globosum]|uniref:Chord-domain-containing protein n=1 Tax=Rhizoclosmatium globosum TaxID=329046 RepID=A0A1Y2CUL1_9FUNG|nr:chord-domain-containing protein [Rhizoclosmatium globosum]|eukprot:ORY50739.1 chord-domain-containing protein [Rhizoclosmatium globosum]